MGVAEVVPSEGVLFVQRQRLAEGGDGLVQAVEAGVGIAQIVPGRRMGGVDRQRALEGRGRLACHSQLRIDSAQFKECHSIVRIAVQYGFPAEKVLRVHVNAVEGAQSRVAFLGLALFLVGLG